MKKNLFRKCAAMVACAAMSMMMVTGCNSNTAGNNATDGTTTGSNAASIQQTEQETTKTAEADKKLSGTISLAGSTSMQKLADALAETFMEANSGVTVTVEYSGSSAGIESLLNGSCDIGDASRNLKDSEKSGGAVENIVAIDGIAVIVDKNNTVAGLTKQQLSDIYTGAVTNWSEVGGSDTPIVVVGREAGSGTRGAFEEILKVEDACKYAVECDSTGAAMAKVASTEGAIGYVSLGSLNDTVKALKIDGEEATEQNIKDGKYKICRPFNIATKKGADNELAKDFISYIMSKEGQQVISDNGYIGDDSAEAYAGTKPSGKVVVGGSSSVSPVMEKLIEAYKKVNTGAAIELQTTDSTTCMTSAIDGSYDIGMASRELQDDEKDKLDSQAIATDGIAVIVNKNNTTDELSSDQVKDIYTGNAVAWDEVVK